MEYYKNLFAKSNIEYIIPFTMLWMSFNNWYMTIGKKSFKDEREASIYYRKHGMEKYESLRLLETGKKNFKNEREAIVHYKNYGRVKDEFLNLVDLDLEIGTFQKDLDGLASNLARYNIKRGGKNEPLLKAGYTVTLKNNKAKFFAETLEIIYQIRCSLMHGDFDTEDKDFLELVGSAHKILYPIMNQIISQPINYDKDRHNRDLFYSEELRGLLESGESPLPLIERVEKDIEILDEETKEHYECNLEERKDDFIFNKRRGELMILRTFFDNDYYKKFSLEDKKSWDKFRYEFVVLELFLSPSVRGSGTISMLLYLMIEMKVEDTIVGNFTSGSSELEKKVQNDLSYTIQLLEQSEFVVDGIKEYLENRKKS